jgi:hypothetical protein
MSATAVHEPKPAAPRPHSFTPVARTMVQRKCACGGTPGADGECQNCKRNRQLVQRRAADSPAPESAPESVHRTLASPGRPLDAGTRDFMESRFGHDFSQVRVHTDSQAGESARDINAHAYTAGSDIAFAPGKYQPESQSGRQLLAHELAHTVQQNGLQRRASDLAVDTAPDSRLEHEADHAVRSVMNGAGAPIIASQPPAATISRAKGDIVTKPVIGKKAKPKTTSSGYTHTVTPTGEGTKETDDTGTKATLEEFSVDPFFLPAEKGPGAFAIYDAMATGGSLESTLELTGSGKTKTALWQERPDTDDLRTIWLQKVGWAGQTSAVVNDFWQRSGGDAEFPKVNSITAQMDHIVELQIGGNNTKENIQPLDPKPNQSSGGAIKGQLQTLAQAIATDTDLSGGNAQQVKMRFTKVVPKGTPSPLSATCPPTKGNCTALTVEGCAMKLQLTKGPGGTVSVARVDYPITTAGRPVTNLKVPVTFASRTAETVTIKGDTENDAASTLIPGLLLNTLSHRNKQTAKPDLIEAQIDTRDKTRLPITLDEKAKPFSLDVAANGALTLPAALKTTSLGFTYKYLSAGVINSVVMNANGGIDWKGTITPTPKFLPKVEVEYKDGTLKLIAQIPEDKLKKQKIFGASITKAAVTITLSPFDVTGDLEFIVGSAAKPAATGKLTLGKDSVGLVGTAKVQLKIPKVDSTEITFEYKGGANREEWSGELKIETSQIKIPYVTGSSIVARVTSKAGVTDITFDGKVSLALPKNRGTAEVSLKRSGGNWYFAGSARLNIPKVDDFSLSLVYDIGSETMTASMPGEDGKMPSKPVVFTITEDFKGTLDKLNLKIAKGGVVTVTGAGGFSFKKGKAAGKVNVELLADGSFNGSGNLTYALSENLTVDGSVEFKEKGVPKLAIKGSLTFATIKLMDAIADNRTLFDKEFSIPIPYASIGGVGLKAIFGVKLEAGYSLGPIVVEPLTFTAGFNPMDDEPQLNLGAAGQLKVPATATLSASLSGGVKIDAYVAEVGGKITITGTIKLQGGLFVPFKGTYSNKEFAVEMTPEAKLKLLLGVALSATVWAKAGVGWLSTGIEKTWILGKREVDTGLGFGIKAPISYSTKTGAKIPGLDKIEFVPPDFSKENLSRIADRLFGEAKGNPPEA